MSFAVVAAGYYVYHRKSMADDADRTRRTKGRTGHLQSHIDAQHNPNTGKFREKEPKRKDEGYLTAPSKQDALNARPSPGVSSGSAV